MWLQFVFPVYIWMITAVIIVVAHYSSTGARFFSSNSVKVLATLFLLSYTKLLCITAFSFTFLDYPDEVTTAVWLYDGNFQYFSPAHAPLTVFGSFDCLPISVAAVYSGSNFHAMYS